MGSSTCDGVQKCTASPAPRPRPSPMVHRVWAGLITVKGVGWDEWGRLGWDGVGVGWWGGGVCGVVYGTGDRRCSLKLAVANHTASVSHMGSEFLDPAQPQHSDL